MKIKPNEFLMLKRFHKLYFNVKAYKNKSRPNIEKFVITDGCRTDIGRKKLILALYTFNFWFLGYSIKPPSKEFVMTKFKKYK